MGWDAYATKDGKDLQVNRAVYLDAELGDPTLREAFGAAAQRVKSTAGSVDGLLYLGALNVSTCGSELSDATGRSVYDENPWTAEFVRTLAARAHWDEERPADTLWARLSAREFLETCAKLNLGIRFSY